MTNLENLVIRPAANSAELHQIEDIQRKAWGTETPLVANMAMGTAIRTGGQVLVALLEGYMVGFSVAFLASHKPRGQSYLFSELVGVHPDYQAFGVGYLLKMAQRARFHEDHDGDSGMSPEMRWTVHPMLAPNAMLNCRKLGAYATCLSRNLYGIQGGDLYGTEPSDRLQIFWNLELDTRAPEFHERVPSLLCPDRLEVDAALLTMADRHDQLILPIPRDFAKLRKVQMELGQRWQTGVVSCLATLLDTRDFFGELLTQGQFHVVNARLPHPEASYVELLLQHRRVPREDGAWPGQAA